MLKIRKPDVPISAQGRINRLSADLNALTETSTEPFISSGTYQAGDVFHNGAGLYIAKTVICKGETVKPGINAEPKTVDVFINELRKDEN